MSDDEIVAVALLTKADLNRLGGNLAKVWPVHDVPGFEDLLQAIDDAESRARKQGNS